MSLPWIYMNYCWLHVCLPCACVNCQVSRGVPMLTFCFRKCFPFCDQPELLNSYQVTTVTQIVRWQAVLSLGIVIDTRVKSEILHRKWEKAIKGPNSSTGHGRSCHRAAWACFHAAMVAGASDVQGQEWTPPALSQGMPGESPAQSCGSQPNFPWHWKHHCSSCK